MCKVTKFVTLVRMLAPDAAIPKGCRQMHISEGKKAGSSGYQTNSYSGDLRA